MNYRHLFHAGNFSDVFRHALAITLIKALQNKDKAFSYIDIHAGAGMYNLASDSAQKTEEYKVGIGRLWQQKVGNPILQLYLQLVASSQPNRDNSLQNYPGSPWYVAQLVSPNDHLILCELHPEVYAELKHLFYGNKQVSVHYRNGYEALKALLPPKERRGLVLIDPPFEKSTEFDDIVTNLKTAYARWPQGIYAIWYPIKDDKKVKAFKNKLLDIPFKQILEVEWFLYPEDSPVGLPACGMIILNPPWQIENSIETLMAELNKLLAISDSSHYKIKWLRKQ